jgi:hypothetical protein
VKFCSPSNHSPANPSKGVRPCFNPQKNPLRQKTELNLEVHPKVEEIELRAYQIYIERGGADGHDVDDWLQAERELSEKYQRTEPMTKKAVA